MEDRTMPRKTGGTTVTPAAGDGGKPAVRRKRKPVFKLAHPDCAGIDVGSASHFVAVPPDRDPQPVREFKSFTGDLIRLAAWLRACGIKTVVMESTGVYWIALYEVLEREGFAVHLVNARHVKNVSGRKSDVLDT
jgi:transposase